MSSDTMESAVAEEARAILTLCGLQDRDFTDILDGIAHKARNILRTLNEGDPDDSDLAEAAEGEACSACGRASIDCSREPCGAVREDRGEDSVYEKLRAAGVELDHHESDLYARDCPEARAIVQLFPDLKVKPFTADDGSGRWLDLPFQYDPFWQAKADLARRVQGANRGA